MPGADEVSRRPLSDPSPHSAGIRQAARSRGVVAVLGVVLVLSVAAFLLVPRTHPVSADTDVLPLLPAVADLGADWIVATPAQAQGGALPQGATRSAHVEYFQTGSQFALTGDINLYPSAGAASAAAPSLLPSGVAGTQDQTVTVSGQPAHLVTFTPPNAGCTTEYALAWQEENLVGVLHVQWKGRNGPDLGDSNPCSVGSVLGPNWVQQLAARQLARVKPLVALSPAGLQLADRSDVRSHRG